MDVWTGLKRSAFSILMILFSILSLLSLTHFELPSTAGQQSSVETELYLTFALDNSSYTPGQTIRMTGYVSTQVRFPTVTTEVHDGSTTIYTVTSDWILAPELHVVIFNPVSEHVYERNGTVTGIINQDVVYFTETYTLTSNATLGTYLARISSVEHPFVVYQVRTVETVLTESATTVTTQYVTTEVDEFPNEALLVILTLFIGLSVVAKGFKGRLQKKNTEA